MTAFSRPGRVESRAFIVILMLHYDHNKSM